MCTSVIDTPYFISVECALGVLRPIQRCTWGIVHLLCQNPPVSYGLVLAGVTQVRVYYLKWA